MTLIQSIILGIVQGATEFIPISSSGHLVLVPQLLGWDLPAEDAFVFNVLIQVATLAAVIWFFWQEFFDITKAVILAVFRKSTFKEPNAKLGFYLLIATLPAGVIGIILNGMIEQVFNNPKITAFFLFGTAILLVVAERAGKREIKSLEPVKWTDALWIGCFQILALFPGISRSGATITGGMLRGLSRRASARFSFLMVAPIIMAAGIKALYDFIVLPNSTENFPILLAGCIMAALVGYFSIRWLLNYLSQRSFYFFAGYCAIFSVINLIIFWLE